MKKFIASALAFMIMLGAMSTAAFAGKQCPCKPCKCVHCECGK